MEPNLCVLMDFENIAAGAEKEGHGRFDTAAVMTRLKEKGRILIARSYGDWGRFAKYKQAMLEQGIQAVELTSYRGQDKNRADIALAVDAMELAFRRDYIDTFVLLSGDSDFTPLVMRLRELDRRVIGIGTRKSSSRLLVESCDEFIFYESITRTQRSARTRTTARREGGSDAVESLSKDDAFAVMVETIEGLQRDEAGPVLAGRVKQSLLRKAPTFDESDYGFTGFARFLEGAQERGLVTLSTDERAGGYRVDLAADETPAAAPVKTEEEPLLRGEPGRLREVLVGRGHDPLTSMMRHVVVHEFTDHVNERARKNKRNTLIYTVGDVARRTRQTDPPVRSRQVRSVLYTLLGAGELMHADGNPIRKESATFSIKKDAEELLRGLRGFYVMELLRAGEKLDDSSAMSELLWGDDNHKQPAEELVAWAQWELTEEDAGRPRDGQPPAGEPETKGQGRPEKAAKQADVPAGDDEDEEAEKPRKKSSRRRRKKSSSAEGDGDGARTRTDEPGDDHAGDDHAGDDPADDAGTDVAATAADDGEETTEADPFAEPPRKRRRRKKKTGTAEEKPAAADAAADAPADEVADAPADAAAEEAPAADAEATGQPASEDAAAAETAAEKPEKKPTRRRTTRKKTTTKAAASADAAPAEEAEAAPEKKPTRRRTTRKKTTTKAAASEGGSDEG